MQWSRYQQAIFDAVGDTNSSLIINAVAGSGKTTTIVEAIRHVRPSKSVCFLAFNKAIAAELGRRIDSPNATCRTLHAAGFAAWRAHMGLEVTRLKVESRKTSRIMRDVLTDRERDAFGGVLTRLVSIAKNSGLVPQPTVMDVNYTHKGLLRDDNGVWADLIDFYNIDVDMSETSFFDQNTDLSELTVFEAAVGCARRVLEESIARSFDEIDFDDMLYMPIITGAGFEKYDVTFLDEAQDVSGIQMEMVARMQGKNSRVIAVGDPCQSIYAFRGALQNSMDLIAERFHAIPLPLSVSYRCPQSVVRHAKAWVPYIEWHADAIEGQVNYLDNWKVGDFASTDAILCRNTKPLIALAFFLIRSRVPCKVLGRDIGGGLTSLVKKMRGESIEHLITQLAAYREREVARLKDNEARIAALDDKLATLDVFLEELAPGASILDLTNEIEDMFADTTGGAMLTLATVHKSKGLEFDRVFVLDAHELMPSRWARRSHEIQQERNLCYVAATRAKRELYYVTSDALRGAEGARTVVDMEDDSDAAYEARKGA